VRGLTRNQLLLVLAAVALLAVTVVFGVFYYQAVSHKAAVASDIEETQANIDRMMSSDRQLTHDVDLLQRMLAPLQRDLAEAPIPTEVDNVEVFDDIHEAAVRAKLDYDYEYKGAKSITIAGTRYQAMTFEIDTSGSLTRLIKFLGLLEDLRDTDYDTLRITNVELDLSGDVWGMEFDIEIIIQGE